MTSPVRMVKDLKSGSLSNLHIAQSDEAFRDPDMADLLRAVKAHSEAQISNLSTDVGAMLRSSVDEALASSSMAADLQNLRDEVAALRQQAEERAMLQDGKAAALQVADGASGQLSAADHKMIVEISQALGLEWSLPAEATPADVLEAAHVELGLETPVGSVREQLQALRGHEGLADDLARHAEARRSFHDGRGDRRGLQMDKQGGGVSSPAAEPTVLSIVAGTDPNAPARVRLFAD